MAGNSVDPNPLSFHWNAPKHRERGLWFWLLLVALCQAGFFYVFQVVYPQSQRFTPIPQQVLMLQPSDPASRLLFNTVQDRDFLYVPAAATAFGAVRLEDQVPRYVPSFEGHTMALEDLPHKEFAAPRPRLLQLDEPVLPPIDFRELKQTLAPILTTPVIAGHLAMRFSKELVKRAVTQSVDLGGLVLNDPASCRFQLGVSSAGKVDFALPLAATETAEVLQEIEKRLRQMRFSPVTAQNGQNTGLTWGLVFFDIHHGGKE